MKVKIVLISAMLLAIGVSSSLGAIGWAGEIWPCSGASYPNNEDIACYVQIWKGGCTEGPGRCPGLAAWLYFKKATETEYDSVAMNYLGEVGNNDEYRGYILATETEAGINEDWYINIYDSTDGSWYIGAQTQGGCGNQNPPFYLVITPATMQDVTVTFRVDMACLDYSWYNGLVYFTGDGPGWNWVPCDPSRQMSDPDGDFIYEGQFTFPAGSNPSVQYKYNKGSCDWEGGANRTFVIDDSGPTQILPIDIWDRWDCCTPGGPPEISGPGSYCIHLCFCDEYLDILLNVPFDPPIIPSIVFVPGCEQGMTQCNEACDPGAGTPTWEIVQIATGQYVLRLCVPRLAGNDYGCFCMTIDQILPVELSTFIATPLVEAVRLDWSTASERDNDHFTIERSFDNATWIEIAEVPGSGTSQTPKSYFYTDEHLTAGTTYYYRLSSVDIGGVRHLYDRTVSATPYGPEAVSEYALTQNYPNPFNPTTSFSYTLKEAGLVTIRVFDITGGEVATLVREFQPAGIYSASFDGRNLPSGIYIYHIQVNDFTATHKMVLLK
ncbi:MAG: T9SS type A sorting domain-containing protein [Calditrichaeota bacterium]|nr:T9SS type A sorting domain-containing protein [Calditrichota bacterium]